VSNQWIHQTLPKCIKKVKYTRKVKRKDFLTEGEYPIVSQEAGIVNGFWNSSDDVFSVETPVVVFGDHTKVLKYIDFDFVLGADGVKLLKPKAFLNPRFFYYQLQTANFESLGYARHFRLLKEHVISYPPLPEQKRIVEILDEAFAAIDKATANTEKNVKNAAELFERKLYNSLSAIGNTWKKRSLSEVCDIVSKLVDPKQDALLDLLHIGAGNMVTRSEDLMNVMTAREEGLISSKFLFDSRMVLYSKIRPYLEKVSRPEFNGLCSADIYPLLPVKNLLHRDFLFYLLRSSNFTNYAMAGSARAGMPKVNRKHLFAYSFMLPSLQEQIQISGGLDNLSSSTNSLREINHQKKEILGELKQSILHKAFTGELTSDFKAVDKALSEAGI